MTAPHGTKEVAAPRVTAVVGLLVVFELVSGFLQGSAPVLVPAVQDWRSISASQAQWYMAVQFLAAAVSVPVFGRLGDLYGHRRLTRIALACVAAGTVLVALAPNLTILLAGRALMGPLAALLPLEIGLVRDRLDLAGGRRAVALLVGALTLGSLLGHGLVGPLLALTGGVRATLSVLAALACACLALSYCAIPESRTRAPGRMDWTRCAAARASLLLFLGTTRAARPGVGLLRSPWAVSCSPWPCSPGGSGSNETGRTPLSTSGRWPTASPRPTSPPASSSAP